MIIMSKIKENLLGYEYDQNDEDDAFAACPPLGAVGDAPRLAFVFDEVLDLELPLFPEISRSIFRWTSFL